MPLLFYPVLMLGMIFVHKVFGAMTIANHRLILYAFEGPIFVPVAIVVLIRSILTRAILLMKVTKEMCNA